MEPIRSEFENDPDMMEIVEEFASELPSRALAMEECMASGEMDKLQTLAHQLKGSGNSVFGASGIPCVIFTPIESVRHSFSNLAAMASAVSRSSRGNS